MSFVIKTFITKKEIVGLIFVNVRVYYSTLSTGHKSSFIRLCVSHKSSFIRLFVLDLNKIK